jgi:hypothetical protein
MNRRILLLSSLLLLLIVSTAPATMIVVIDENGHGEVSQDGGNTFNPLPVFLNANGAPTYTLPEPFVEATMGILENTNGSPVLSDIIDGHNTGPNGTAQLSFYSDPSNDPSDNDLADFANWANAPAPTFFRQEGPIALTPQDAGLVPAGSWGVYYDSTLAGNPQDNSYYFVSDSGVPEPSTFVLLGLGVVALCGRAIWRPRRRAA